MWTSVCMQLIGSLKGTVAIVIPLKQCACFLFLTTLKLTFGESKRYKRTFEEHKSDRKVTLRGNILLLDNMSLDEYVYRY